MVEIPYRKFSKKGKSFWWLLYNTCKYSTITEDNPMLNNIESLPNEEWKELEHYPNYLISNLGRVWSKARQKTMKTFEQNSGYLMLSIVRDDGVSKRWLLHRLVAFAFIPSPENKLYINHKDGNKHNNSVNNLEWVTCSENILHARRTGLNPYNLPTLNRKLNGQKKAKSKFFGVSWDITRQKWISTVVYQGKRHYWKRFDSELDAARHYDAMVIKMGLEHIKTLNNV